MIDQWSHDGTGWARFSDDMTMRYRLARRLNDRGETALCFMNLTEATPVRAPDPIEDEARRVVFLMLNPSTADAFKLDPTVKRCMGFARAWGADVLEVVNIFALRSTDPDALYGFHSGTRGDDEVNDREILDACSRSARIITGWGKHGSLDQRGWAVRRMLASAGYDLYHLGQNKDGSPKHPLYLKGGTAPQEFVAP